MILLTAIALVSMNLAFLFFVFGFGVGLSRAGLVFVIAPAVSLLFRRDPTFMSLVLGSSSVGVLAVAVIGFWGMNWTDDSDCAGKVAAAITRVPNSYWAWWIVLGGVAWLLLVAGALVALRARYGNALLALGAATVSLSTVALLVSVNAKLKTYYPADFVADRCGEPFGGPWLPLFAAPVVALALAAVLAGWRPGPASSSSVVPGTRASD